jgi:hypothetical protein
LHIRTLTLPHTHTHTHLHGALLAVDGCLRRHERTAKSVRERSGAHYHVILGLLELLGYQGYQGYQAC